MKKNKGKDIITCMRLMKYGMSAKQCFGTMILFMGIGIAFEMLIVLGAGFRNGFWLDYGALFLYSAAMYPAQILMTLDISGMVQASPYKKLIQTGAMSITSLCGNLGALAIVLVIRVLGAYVMPERAFMIWATLPMVGILGLGLSIMGALMYKFYILSIIVLAVIFGTFSSLVNFQDGTGMNTVSDIMGRKPLPVAIVFCIAMIFLGNGIQYLVARALYKRPYSRGAFGNAVGKKFV